MILDRIAHHLAATGFFVLGAGGEDGKRVLIGNAGPDMWRRFSAERRDEPDPLDSWTRRTLDRVAGALADEIGPVAVIYPFDGPPYPPFQRWAVAAGIAFPSPIGPLIHPVHGLWHAYRGAFQLAEALPHPPPPGPSPCESCAARPCLSACPVEAFDGAAYDVAACVAHIGSPAGADCLDQGCRARRACPIGRAAIQEPAQARFHMDHFRAANRRPRAATAMDIAAPRAI